MVWTDQHTSIRTAIFQGNDEFLGKKREQNPIYALDLSLIRWLRPGFWASADFNYYFGGRAYIDGGESANLQRNSRLGLTIVYPFKGLGALRANYSTGLTTKSGGDYNAFGISWIYLIP